MKVVLIGSGNVATHLSKALVNSGNKILQVFSKTYVNAQALADRIDAMPIADLSQVDTEADLYIISVKDDKMQEVIEQLPDLKGMVVHTAGSVNSEMLKRFENYGVFYPFQTFSKQAELDFRQVPILVEANNASNKAILFELGDRLSNKVLKASSDQRAKLHIAAVFACNFVNHMYRLADEVLAENDLSFDLLHPLITETAAKVQSLKPNETQTGPAGRKDFDIINKHLTSLEGNDELVSIYKMLTDSIIDRSS